MKLIVRPSFKVELMGHLKSVAMPLHKHLLRSLLPLWLPVVAGECVAATIEQETIARLNQIRAIRAVSDSKAIEQYNKQMDEAWQFFSANKTLVLPILRNQLKDELTRPQRSDLLLLDVGLFVHSHDNADGKDIAKGALFALNPRAAIVQANNQELFEFAHAVAREHDSRAPAFIDRAFLASDQKVFVPQHALTLDPTLICAYLFGVYGPESEAYLRTRLADKAVSKRIIEILVWIGSPDSIGDVKGALTASPDYDTLIRATSYMMQSAGPAGRAFMVSLDSNRLDAKAQQYLTKIRKAAQDVSFQSMQAAFSRFPGESKLSDDEVKRRLGAMNRNFGRDDKTSPLAILGSGVNAELLIAELIRIRSRTFFRISDEALSDVHVTNTLINALRYRGK